jgi:hypothetical protein
MPFDLIDDWKIWDNTEQVALVTGVRGSTFTNWTATAKRRQLRFRELAASGGAYTSRDMVWLVPVQFLPIDANPRLGDRVEPADGSSWTVTEATLNTWRSWWSLTTRNLVLVNDLSSKATLMRPTNTQDAAGGRVPVFAAVDGASNIAIRVQETEAVVEVRNGKRQATRRFTAYCEKRIYPQANDRITTSNGAIYQITGWRNADRLDLLLELDLEIVQ